MNLQSARENLKNLDPQVRRQALDHLLSACREGKITCEPGSDLVNMHCHTFFSYNGYGHSPSSLAWLARQRGWHAIGMVDFDVLDAVDECLASCDLLGVRAMAGMETRAYLPEFSTREINSPGEPGVLYHIGAGFVSSHAPEPAREALADMHERAAGRNRDMVARLNAYLDPVGVDYDRDLIPLTPAGNVTERHIVVAYDVASRRMFVERQQLLAYWAEKLEMSADEVDAFLGDAPFPHNQIRSKLMKRSGVGYVQPGPNTFPQFDQVNQAFIACGAIPLCAWLDGTSEGEQNMEELLSLQVERGVAGLNIIPDRNWNIADPEERALKVGNLYQMVELARSMDLPIVVGTEMNKAGQKLVDDFCAQALQPLGEDFVRGADFVYGHTLMQRALGLGYQSDWAKSHLPRRRERNAFYIKVGQMVEPGQASVPRVAKLDPSWPPQKILAALNTAS